ncbi:MAG TPA: ROK family protein, partial [Candidatus Sulfomarinibacteraceae bacterium]|nr:ROK family protein [Candidatus Sulfomarinibacteraceae bacterium]
GRVDAATFVQHMLYVTVSTGVGGGWILNGRPWRGAEGMAGEIGHTVVDPRGPRCLCGKRGCVERLASGPYMAQDARARLAQADSDGEILRQMAGGDLQQVTGKLLSAAAQAGDALAQAILDRGAWALGMGIGNAANLVNPQRVVLGGGVTGAGDRWWRRVRETVAQVTLPEVHVEVVPAALGDDAPLWGAVVLAEEVGGWRLETEA